ncbi:MAG TPA: VWA domain-containing protein [Thermoanaerobaculia bacterium]|nr:VWA domain-containing protein [Thermoanaerobaculia bacterium]
MTTLKRIAIFSFFLFAAANVSLWADDGNTPPQQPQKAADNKPAPPELGVRKLSRRERKERIKNLPDKYKEFLTDVEPIMQPAELDTFLLLETDAQRDLYIEDFWHRRDVAQGTTNHTFKKQYYDRIEDVKAEFRYVSCDRARIWLIHGQPDDRIKVTNCRLLQPIEIWKYFYIPGMGHDVRFLFVQPRNGVDFRLWVPMTQDAMTELISQDAIGMAVRPEEGVANVFAPASPGSPMTKLEFSCQNGDEVLKAVAYSQLNKTDIVKVFEPAPVNEEDVHKILRSVVLATPNAPKLSTELAVAFPARQGGKTDAQITLLVPRSEVKVKDVNGSKLYSLEVTGEVLKDNALWENYRYRFDYPGDMKEDKLAVVIDRFLRPAGYRSRIKVVDPNSGAEAIVEKDLTVPEIFDTPEQQKQKAAANATVAALKDTIEANETKLRIVPLTDDLLSGVQHIETIISGDIKAVEFYLDGKKIMIKRQPPFTLDLDFGEVPQVRHVRAVALNDKGEPITGDEIDVNTGNDPFRVRIVSPRVALKAHGKTRVEMAVNVPDGKKLDHVELYLNNARLAELFDPPYVQTIDIPATEGVGYIRAVAKLKDDQQPPVEDVVMINTPQFMEEVNVHLVELPTTVIRNGHPVNDLPQTAFKVLDEGKPVSVTKFEHVTNLPLSIGMAIDTSASMQPRMSEAQKAGSQFFTNVMRKGDRAFLVSFDSQPQLIQRWSTKVADVNAGLAKLRAEESTTLYDAVVYSLYNFVGVKGQKALVVITDGKDTASKFSFDQAVEYARRAAVPIYAIGIGIRATEVDTRYKLSRFCSETGGNAYYIEAAADLGRIYTDIQNELRSQYILGFYPATGIKPGSKWREVSVQVGEGRAKTIRGYYP